MLGGKGEGGGTEMCVLVLVVPRFPIPPEMLPALLDRFAAWREQ